MAKIFAPAAESAAIKQVTAPAAATSNAAPAAEQKEPQTNPTSRRRAPRYCSKECVWGINKKVYRSFRFVEANQQKLKKE